MLTSLAIKNYRSLLELIVPLGSLNVITGPNGSGKSNVYRALRLLAETATGGVVQALASEGGLPSTFWAGPATLSAAMKDGEVPIQGTRRTGPARLGLGFAADDFSYAISLGLPAPQGGIDGEPSKFALDPEIKRECVWVGDAYRPASCLVDRKGPVVKVRSGRRWQVVAQHVAAFDSLYAHIGDPATAPEVVRLRESIRAWRFYDHFRTDSEAAARQAQLGTRTPVLDDSGRSLAAALQTIREIGDGDALDAAIDDAFPGGSVEIAVREGNWFSVQFHQQGLLRPLTGTELSDGTLRYLLLIAALLTPRPPPLIVLNEPETSLHPDLLPALGRLIARASQASQVWVVSHASRLIHTLEQYDACQSIALEKSFGQTTVVGQRSLDRPPWQWPD